MDAYGDPNPHLLKYTNFGALNIYTVHTYHEKCIYIAQNLEIKIKIIIK
jgi:hypothetical protein